MLASFDFGGLGMLAALFVVMAASVWLGVLAQKAVERGSFMKGFFLGNRDLGSWALALTATVQSGGTFVGFPSLVYSYGWTVAIWIAGYIVVPLSGFALVGKRLAQFSRLTGAITVPDLFRHRFQDPRLGLVASLLIMYFLIFTTIAQFKAGALVMKLAWPGSTALALPDDAAPADAAASETQIDYPYYFGLALFTLTVVGYTVLGGFLASVWADLFQSVLMLIGVMILLVVSLQLAGGLEQATRTAIEKTGPGYVFAPGYDAGHKSAVAAAQAEGRSPPSPRMFLPVGLAFSMFFLWVFGGVGSPASIVRVMACRDATTLRRSIIILGVYNFLIYIPLIIICICARAILPELSPQHSDEVIPRMSMLATAHMPGGSFVAGLILAAPFGAVMATVSCYLLVIASGLVHDVYQRFIDPDVTEHQLKRMTTIVMILIGVLAVAANLRPIDYLQVLVVFSAESAAATFVIPALMAAYWRRASATGVLAAMLAGGGTTLGLWIIGSLLPDAEIGARTSFQPYYLGEMIPIVWSLLASLITGVVVSLSTRPPRPEWIAYLFDGGPAPPNAQRV